MKVLKCNKYYLYKRNNSTTYYQFNTIIQKYYQVENINYQITLFDAIGKQYKDNQISISMKFKIEVLLQYEIVQLSFNQTMIEAINNNKLQAAYDTLTKNGQMGAY